VQNGELGIFVETRLLAGVSDQLCLEMLSGIGVYYFGDARLVRAAAKERFRFGVLNNEQGAAENNKVGEMLQCCLATKTE
jgi:hypothetical protein